MYCPLCGMVHVQDVLLLIEKSSDEMVAAEFYLSPFEWPLIIWVTPINHIQNVKCVKCVIMKYL